MIFVDVFLFKEPDLVFFPVLLKVPDLQHWKILKIELEPN